MTCRCTGHFYTKTCKVGPSLALAIPAQNKKLGPSEWFYGQCVCHHSNLLASLSSVFLFLALMVLVHVGLAKVQCEYCFHMSDALGSAVILQCQRCLVAVGSCLESKVGLLSGDCHKYTNFCCN